MSGKRLVFLLTFAIPVTAQPTVEPHTDPEKIADALKGGPPYITDGASVLDWPAMPTGRYRELRKGHTEWTCLPTSPQHQPVCADSTFLRFFQDAVAHRPVRVDKVGIAYMYEGDTVVPPGGGHSYQVEPHIMLVIPNGAGLESYTADGSTGKAYINFVPGTSTPYLVIPIHENPQKGDGEKSVR